MNYVLSKFVPYYYSHIVRVYESANFVYGLRKENTHMWKTYRGEKSKFFESNKLSGYKQKKKNSYSQVINN